MNERRNHKKKSTIYGWGIIGFNFIWFILSCYMYLQDYGENAMTLKMKIPKSNYALLLITVIVGVVLGIRVLQNKLSFRKAYNIDFIAVIICLIIIFLGFSIF